MSILLVRNAIEEALTSITPALSTAFENVDFSPVTGIPYQRIWMPAFATENPTMGGAYHRIRGYVQIDLCYPLQVGTADLADRAELIKALFKRGASFTNGGLKVIIETTPTVGNGSVDGDRWVAAVKFRYWADVFQ